MGYRIFKTRDLGILNKKLKLAIQTTGIKGTLSQTFFGFFSKTAPKLRLSTFDHAGNVPRT